MKKICICGHFGFGHELLNGQTIKTKIITDSLTDKYGIENIFTIDTHGGKFKQIGAILKLIRALRSCENIVLLPAHKALKVLIPIVTFFNKFYRRKIHYIVIGGWLADYLNRRKKLERKLKKLKGIYVETSTLKDKLQVLGFENIIVLPNCKKLNILSSDELVYSQAEPRRLCTFSRVMQEKGIVDAIRSVQQVNEKLGRVVYELDIYGQIDSDQKEWFAELKDNFPPYVSYKGEVSFDRSSYVLKDYFALLFPTHFYTEGIPGTIIDAYSAGVPVISSKWQSFSDVIDDNSTGIGYEFDNSNELVNILIDYANKPDILSAMKINCIHKAKEFTVDKVLQNLVF